MKNRYQALDGWRGILACIVVLFHTEAYSHLRPLLQGAYLSVDFFFVLSGFVLTRSYRDRLLSGFSMRAFLILRLCRVYPLHLIMLLAFLGFYLLKNLLMGGYASDTYSLPTFVGNVFLIQSLGVFDTLSWNGPSWSISVEFYTCVLFVCGLLLLRRRIWIAQVAVVAAAPVLFATREYGLNATYDLGLLRCVYGFSAGCLCHAIHARISQHPALNDAATMSLAETLVVLGAAAFAFHAGPSALSALMPYVLSVFLLVFAQERGILGRALRARPFAFLGTISYSIYMVHFLIIELFFNAAGMLAKRVGGHFYTSVVTNGQTAELLGTRLWHGDVVLLLLLASSIVAGHLVHGLVEKPAHAWSRRFSERLAAQSSPGIVADLRGPGTDRRHGRGKRPSHEPERHPAGARGIIAAARGIRRRTVRRLRTRRS